MALRRLALLLSVVVALAACARKGDPGAARGAPPSDRAYVTLEKVDGHAEPSGSSATVRSLARGAEVKVLESRQGFWRIQVAGGGDVWVEAGAFERKSDREEREKRAARVAGFVPQPGRAVESAPVLLAPAYGAARWSDVEDGDDVEVLLHDHDFYGIRVPGAKLAFVPARSVRLLPSEMASGAEPPAPRRQIVPQVTSLGDPGVFPGATPGSPQASPPPIEAPHRPAEAPLESLPPGGEPPSLVVRTEPIYPDAARRAGIGGEVVLRVVVTAEGTIGKVDVVTGAPAGLTEAAVDAVARWRYRPARVGDRAVAVVKLVRIRFASGR